MRGHRILIGAAVAVLAAVSVAWVQSSTEIWLKGPVYLGTSKTQISNAAGTLSFSAATSVETGITAFATGGQASATQLSSDISIITTCATAGDSVKLPAAASGRIMSVTNSGAAALAVFPGSGDAIDGLAGDASVTIPVTGTRVFRGISATAWKSEGPATLNGSTEWTGATGTNLIRIPDNLANALVIEESTNDYMAFVSTNSAEAVVLSVPQRVSLSATVSAAGSSKTDCTALTKEFNVVTTATSMQGVCLLTAVAGQHQKVENDTAVTVVVYPLDAGNDTLTVHPMAAAAADLGFAVGPGGSLDCTASDGTEWFCTPTLGYVANLAGAGTTIADFGAMAAVNMGSHVRATGANGTVGITLPNEDVPTCIVVHNAVSSAVLKLSPHNSDNDTIAGAAADAEYNLGASANVMFCTVDGTAWLVY